MVDYSLPLDQLPDPLPIEPLRKPFDMTITPPGSKSITCRAYVLAALAEGESKIIRPLRADDPDHLLKALCTLGAEARWEGEDVYIKGVGGRFPRGGNLYMGDGGAPTRFMIAASCLAAEPVTIDASPRMRERPIAEGVEMLRQLGAKIEYLEEEGRLPVRVLPSHFTCRELTVEETATSQFVSAIIMIAPAMKRGILLRFAEVATSPSYVRMTNLVMLGWGIKTTNTLCVPPFDVEYAAYIDVAPQAVSSREFSIEPDASSALYWFCAAAMNKKSRIAIPQISALQPDLDLIYLLEEIGSDILDTCQSTDPLVVSGTGKVRGFVFDAGDSPDGAVMFSLVAASAKSLSKITGLRTLRVKETDRIAALANELRKVGCTVNTGEDWIEITPPSVSPPHAGGYVGDPIIIETYNDHRMAMSFAILGLAAPNGHHLAIRNPACVKKSYPTFWKDFAKLYAE